MKPLVDCAGIQSASLHNPLPLFFHAYILPFTIIWPVFIACYLNEDFYDDYIEYSEWTTFYVGAIGSLQALTWLCTKWSVNLQALFTTTSSNDPATASLIKVTPNANAGTPEICAIKREKLSGSQRVCYFTFQKRKFLYDNATKTFAPLSFAIDGDVKPLVGDFKNSVGLETDSQISELRNHYGDNIFDIPIPTFSDLFKEHAVAPFFVFQVACVGLWLLDEYWYYSVFTLIMLLVFESTVVWQRQRTLTEFRSMSITPYPVHVFRKDRWEEISSAKLLPGDLVSVNRTKENSGVACDMVVINGSVIVNEAMLSGESTPVRKDSLLNRPDDAPIDPEGVDKTALLYGGTKVLQILQLTEEDEPSPNQSSIPPPPDNGALAVVVKTGFETSQGSLLRTMIFATERVSGNNLEAFVFLFLLLLFAIAASWYVWQHGVEHDRKRSKLFLDCVLIITSVVPPELPMQLSLAVNTSLATLAKHSIFCTEPFRIPFAGRVDVACFDKTGTLTGEDLLIEGVICPGEKWDPEPPSTLTPATAASDAATLVLATAHALARLDDGDIVGEPMEKEAVAAIRWELAKGNVVENKTKTSAIMKRTTPVYPKSAHILRQFPFSSTLKRQSSISAVTHVDFRTPDKKFVSTLVATKGAPETIWHMIKKPCSKHIYDSYYKSYARQGGRVLALAYKVLSPNSVLDSKKINAFEREEIESDLIFAGFLVLQTPLKEDAVHAIRMLNESSHRCIMITGDNPLTAIHVARQVEIVDRECWIFDRAPVEDDLHDSVSEEEKKKILSSDIVMRNVEDTKFKAVDSTKELDPTLLSSHDLCITGHAIEYFKSGPAWNQILRHTWVYARVSPKQKEEILIGLKDLGYTTLMCGDGTNDVGALKQAHIGVALLNGSQKDLDRMGETYRVNKAKEIYEKQCSLMQRFNQPRPPVPLHIAHLYPPDPPDASVKYNPHYEKAVMQQAKAKGLLTAEGAIDEDVVLTELPKNAEMSLSERLQSMMEQNELDAGDPPMIKLGDASCAAPFTSKLANVTSIPNIIRQGRCTLVATIQMYKILALNCLISAYSLSVLYLDGFKFGDAQVTVSGIMTSICFMCISRARPVERLSKERPQNNIMNVYILGSIFGQFAIHIATLIFISRYVQSIEPMGPVDVDAETEAEPSLLNSAIFLLQIIQQISTFAINYQGRPFRESIRENPAMYWSLVGVAGIAFSCATELVPEINSQLKLVPFTWAFKSVITSTMLFDYGACWLIEEGFKALFSDYKPKDIAARRPDQEARDLERNGKGPSPVLDEDAANKEKEALRLREKKERKRVTDEKR